MLHAIMVYPGRSRAARTASAALLISLLPALAVPAGAASFHEGWKGEAPCFARNYDAKHLAAHPRQRLTQFALRDSSLPDVNGPGQFEVTISFTVRGRKEVYEAEGICRDASSKVRCGIEGDGGSFTMQAEGPNLLLHITRIAVEGEQDFSPEIGVGGDDRVVRLYRSPARACNFD
jgi:hypothetical protein